MKIKKNNGFTDLLELTDENDKVVHALRITLDLDKVVQGIKPLQEKFAQAETKYNETGDIEIVYNAALDLFNLLLGKENTDVIKEWYGESKLGMINDICPYVATVIYPQITALAKNRAEEYKAFKRKNKRQHSFEKICKT